MGWPPRSKAYPRTCGGAYSRCASIPAAKGLSPHLRGSPQHLIDEGLEERPIPAPAGEPSHVDALAWLGGAYPRTCGGARPGVVPSAGASGLSPHLRGSLYAFPQKGGGIGPIPAPAGEPRSRA